MTEGHTTHLGAWGLGRGTREGFPEEVTAELGWEPQRTAVSELSPVHGHGDAEEQVDRAEGIRVERNSTSPPFCEDFQSGLGSANSALVPPFPVTRHYAHPK